MPKSNTKNVWLTSYFHLLRQGFPDKAVGKRFGLAPRYATGRTDRVACRSLIAIQTISTEIALDRSFLIVIILHGPEGTGFQALFTANADIFIDEYQPLFIS